MNILSDITNVENNTEVIFVHAFVLNNLLFVFSHFRKKLSILISVGSQLFSEIIKCIVGCIFNSVGHITQACKTKLFNRCFDFDN
jgi:hypothetical protein